GASLRVRVSRAGLAEAGRYKLAQARPTSDRPCSAPSLAQALAQSGARVEVVRRFPAGCWEDVFAEAWSGMADFPGGSLSITPTPAMTLIDIDGTLPPCALCEAAVPAIARAIRRCDIAGSV